MRNLDFLFHPPDGDGLSHRHGSHVGGKFASNMPAMFFVEGACAIITDLTLQPDAVMPLLFQLRFSSREYERRDAASVPCRQDENLSDAIALPAGKADDFIPHTSNDTVDIAAFHACLKKLKRTSRSNLRREMRMTIVPAIMPNASERRNVSGARKSDLYVRPLAHGA